jgi:hypothetical protein
LVIDVPHETASQIVDEAARLEDRPDRHQPHPLRPCPRIRLP